LAAAVFLSVFGTNAFGSFAESENTADSGEDGKVVVGSINQSVMSDMNRDKIYYSYINRHAGAPEPQTEIAIKATDFHLTEPDVNGVEPQIEILEAYEGVSDVLYWHNDAGLLTYDFNVEQEGLYCLEMQYFPTSAVDPVSGKSSANTVEIGVQLDGEYPFLAANDFELDRLWMDDQNSRDRDDNDNELRAKQIKYDTWMTYPIKDREGLYNEPYQFYLTEGAHTLTIEGIKVITIFKSFTFKNYGSAPAYVAPSQSELDGTPALTTDNQIGSKTIFLQGEHPLYKNAATLYETYDRTSYNTNPSNPTKQRFNTIGQATWNKTTQAITWEFSVPNDGYYRIAAKVRQNITRGFFSNRKIYIDGVVPSEAFELQRFKYDTEWYMQTLTDPSGNDAYVYLEAGKHTLTMEAVPGYVGEIMQRLDEVVYSLNNYYRRILMITGPSPDIYNDYFLDRQIPDMLPTFRSAAALLRAEKAAIEEMSGSLGGSGASVLETLAVVLDRCVARVDDIPAMRQSIKDTLSAVSAWMREYRDQPLEIDYIEIGTVHEQFSSASGNFFEQILFDFNSFIGSFFEDYTVLSKGTNKSLNVWVSMGRDQAIIVKELVDSDFNVNNSFDAHASINLVQGSILEASLAGKGPDIALFIGGDYPIQLAARGLLVDFTQFTDYNDVIQERFNPNVMTLYTYRDGVYGLPVSQNFPMLFYRTDVFTELGISPPETWQDFIDIVPVMQRKYLGVGLLNPNNNLALATFEPGDTFVTLVLQKGLNLFNEDLTATSYDNQKVIEAFETWTKFYTVYSFDQVYDAFTRFRTGEMPMLINAYTFFNQVEVTAPEIKGLWDFTLVPGTPREDGTVDHTVNSGSGGAVVFSKVSLPAAAWEFVKWFTSTDVMTSYGQSVEALMGQMGRFDTANVNALKNLSWSTDEYNKLAAQMAWTREVPVIPASYSITRDTKNAFRSVVNQFEDTRFALQRYRRTIDKEIARKNAQLNAEA
jgi:ABC-type glycerol-3-phosphate transport system substrate-binding protein